MSRGRRGKKKSRSLDGVSETFSLIISINSHAINMFLYQFECNPSDTSILSIKPIIKAATVDTSLAKKLD